MKRRLVEVLILTAVLVLGFSVLSTVSYAASDDGYEYGTVTASSLMVRVDAGTDNAAIGKLANGTTLSILSERDGWYEISAEGLYGWVCADYVCPWNEATAASEEQPVYLETELASSIGVVRATNLMVRVDAGTENAAIGKLPNGTELSILAEKNGWYQVNANGLSGWVCGDYVILGGSTAAASAPSESSAAYSSGVSGSSIVEQAKVHIGKPYAYGSTGPDAFDCSGLLYVVYRANGIAVPRTAAAYADIGTAVSIQEARPGDVVCFCVNGNGVVSHVGIYVGGTEFLHAGCSTGVTISDMNSSYWGPKVHSIRRVI